MKWIVLLCTIIFAAHAKAQPENFLILTDVHLNPLSHHSMNFSPHQKTLLNDLDKPTFNHLIHHIKNAIKTGRIKKPKFILYLGDIVGHERPTKNIVLGSEAYFFKTLSHEFPNTPILYTCGNIDSFTSDYGPFLSSIQKGDQTLTPINIARLNSNWKGDFISTGQTCHHLNFKYPCILSQNINNGYYSVYIARNFRIISLNSVMLSNLYIIKNEYEIDQQLQWLKSQLNEAQSHGESVILAMHISPGKTIFDNQYFWDKKSNSKFLEIVRHYQSNIVSILAAHTHFNELKIIKDPKSQKNIIPIYINGALSTAFGNAPSINLFSYENINHQWHLTDREVWLFYKKLKDEHDIELKKVFSFKKTYCHDRQQDISNCLKNITLKESENNFFKTNHAYFKKVNFPKNFLTDIPSQ